jgi:hypothetical protein
MKTTDPIDAARVELLLTELRLPAIKAMWSKLAEQSDASSVTSPKRGCRSAKLSPTSTSTPCRWSAKPKSWR